MADVSFPIQQPDQLFKLSHSPRKPFIPMKIKFFPSAAAFRSWLKEHHAAETELWVGYQKKESGRGGITYPESLDIALCYGWIDGVRKSVDTGRYTIRFTPRRNDSPWSAVNIRKAKALIAQGLMQPAGLKAFETRRKTGRQPYSYEQRPQTLVEPYCGILRKNSAAWAFFSACPPSYQKTATWWIISAKQEETRRKRLEQLIRDSARKRKIPPLRRRGE